MSEKTSKFGSGFIIGAIIGGLLTFFFNPKWGKKNRADAAKQLKKLKKIISENELKEHVKEMFGEVSDECVRLYRISRDEVIKLIDEMKEEIDKEKYVKLVEKAMEFIKQDTKVSGDKLRKIKDRLLAEWTDEEIEEPIASNKRKIVN